MRSPGLILFATLLAMLLVGDAQAQERRPHLWEFQIWNACGGTLSPDDGKWVAEKGAFHVAADGAAVLHLRWQFLSAAFAATALEREHLGSERMLSRAPLPKSVLTEPSDHLILTRLDDL